MIFAQILEKHIARRLIKLRIQLVYHLYGAFAPGVCCIGPDTILKSTPFLQYAEVANMQFVTANTTIPVPRVHDYFINKNACLVMEFIHAYSLDKVWTSMSGDERQNILSQHRDFLNQLRQLVPSRPGCVETAAGSPCFDIRGSSTTDGGGRRQVLVPGEASTHLLFAV